MTNEILERPKSAYQVASWSESIEDFGFNLKDWMHELKLISSRPQLAHAISTPPPRLHKKFINGDIADAFLAAYVEHLCIKFQIQIPSWTQDPSLILETPWFAENFKSTRNYLLINSPYSFKNRNLFTIPEVTVKFRPGRPSKSRLEKQKKAALRQKAYRKRRAQELDFLRKNQRNL